MTTENKVPLESNEVEETTDSPAPAVEVNEESSELESKDESKQEDEPVIDYAALLEEEKAKTKRAEDKIVKMKKTQSKETPPVEEEDERSDEDRVAAMVKEQVQQIADGVREEIVSSELEDLLGEVSSNPDEQKLIEHVYNNRVVKSGYTRAAMRADLIDAKLLANKSLLLKNNKEMSEALKSKSTLSSAPNFGSGSRKTEEPTDEFNAEERKMLAKFGVKK